VLFEETQINEGREGVTIRTRSGSSVGFGEDPAEVPVSRWALDEQREMKSRFIEPGVPG
jgi:hypothetical protein